MTSQPSDPDDGGREDAAPGRTAFDALNPYGDFGGSEPSSGRLLLVVIVFLLAVSGAVVVGGLWAKDAFDAHARQERERLAKEERQLEAPAAAGAADTAAALEEPPPPSEEPPSASDEPRPASDEPPPASDDPPPASDEPPSASDEPRPASDNPPPASAEPSSASDEPPPAPAAPAEDVMARKPRAPPPPPGLFLRVSRDRSDAEAEGLEQELKQGFLERLAALAPDTPVKTSARPQPGDLDVKLVLRRLERASGRSAHDVTASCAAGIRPPEALPRGRADAQGKAQGPEAGPALAKLAARRCGAFLAEQIAPVARSLN